MEFKRRFHQRNLLIIWGWKRRYPRTNNTRKRRTNRNWYFENRYEDEATKTAKVEENEEEKNENTLPLSSSPYTFEDNDLSSLSENEEYVSNVGNKELPLTFFSS